MLTESAEQRGAVVGVHRKRCHELAGVLTHLCEWIKCRMGHGHLFSALPACGMAPVGQLAAAATALHLHGTHRRDSAKRTCTTSESKFKHIYSGQGAARSA